MIWVSALCRAGQNIPYSAAEVVYAIRYVLRCAACSWCRDAAGLTLTTAGPARFVQHFPGVYETPGITKEVVFLFNFQPGKY